MKLHKISMALAFMAATLGFTACSDSNTYEKGAPAGSNSVAFVEEFARVLSLSDTEFKVYLSRGERKGELVVPIRHIRVPECMSLPTEAKFADGDTLTSITVKVNDKMKAFENYNLSLSIDHSLTNPYSGAEMNPFFNISVKKEDYRVIGKATFMDNVLFGNEWAVDIEYSPLLNLYRIPDAMVKDTPFFFTWDGKSFAFATSTGEPTVKFAMGYIHASYGMISLEILPTEDGEASDCGYEVDEEDGEYFYFASKFTVPAGSFGQGYNYLLINEWFEKPWEKK